MLQIMQSKRMRHNTSTFISTVSLRVFPVSTIGAHLRSVSANYSFFPELSLNWLGNAVTAQRGHQCEGMFATDIRSWRNLYQARGQRQPVAFIFVPLCDPTVGYQENSIKCHNIRDTGLNEGH